MTFEQTETLREVCLEGAVNIVSASELKEHLAEALSLGQQLRVHMEQATDLDICILQLLIAAVREWKQAGIECTLIGPLSESLSFAITEAGLDSLTESLAAGVLSEV